MILNYYKSEFSWNFGLLRIFGMQQRLNDRAEAKRQPTKV